MKPLRSQNSRNGRIITASKGNVMKLNVFKSMLGFAEHWKNKGNRLLFWLAVFATENSRYSGWGIVPKSLL